MDVAAGEHTIALTASTLSKGSVSDANDNPVPSFDDYVIVHLPLAAGDAASRRFFMLNGVGAMANFTLSAVGAVRLMFIDSDATYNEGQGTVTLDATGPSTTVDGMANVLAWNSGCSSTPAMAHGQRPPASRDAHRQHAVRGRRFQGRFRAAAPAQREGRWIRLALSS